MAHNAPVSPISRTPTTNNGLVVVFGVFSVLALIGLAAAMWCSSLPNSHNLGMLVWPATFVLVAICIIVAVLTATLSRASITARALTVVAALLITGALAVAFESDMVGLRWPTAESAFDRAAADAPTGSTSDGGWIAGYQVGEVRRDAHDNVYFTIDDTGLLASDSGFAKLPAYASADTDYRCYIHLREDWYYWLPTGMCPA